MKLYCINYEDYESGIIGVYSSKEEAMSRVTELINSEWTSGCATITVFECETCNKGDILSNNVTEIWSNEH